MLTGEEIRKQWLLGNIDIEGFNDKQLNPNSYNLILNDELEIYDIRGFEIIDSAKEYKTKKIIIPDTGLILKPGELYLGRTKEYTKTRNFIPCLSGRSSIGRLGINVHVTAGFGDIGFEGYWTLEIFVIKPVIIYPNMEIAQIYYFKPDGDITKSYNGKYQRNNGIDVSRYFMECKNNIKEI